jgi:hypothetical protein
MEIILSNKNNKKDMVLNETDVESQVMIEHLMSNTMIDLAVYYSSMTLFSVISVVILNYLMPQLDIDPILTMLII